MTELRQRMLEELQRRSGFPMNASGYTGTGRFQNAG